MISDEIELKEYLERDKEMLGIPSFKKRPRTFYDDVWKFQITLRKAEYATNCCSEWVMKIYWFFANWRFHLGTGAKVIEDIVIADNVSIGAGAVVNRSFLESGNTIAGVPAKKISENGSHDYLIMRKGKL